MSEYCVSRASVTVMDSVFHAWFRTCDGCTGLGRVVDLVSVLVSTPRKELPSAEVSLSGCEVPEKILSSFILSEVIGFSFLLCSGLLNSVKPSIAM